MPDHNDVDLTLPSVVASLPGRYRERRLSLTVVFHPSTQRIGASAVVPRHDRRAPWVLGRRSPLFLLGPEPGCPLEDPHVSRHALELDYDGQRAVIRRLAASSRCQVAGRELQDSVELDHARLVQGVPLILGHSIVLLLRLVDHGGGAVVDPDATGMLIGSSPYMQGLRGQVAQVGGSDLDVLIRGETGTGKELVAMAVHAASCRARAELVSVNMAAIPSELAAAALFGSARGAFTGADKAGIGYFQRAEGGSLFLDEIGDTPAVIQPQLLRALQQREIQSVGGPIRHVNVRVISATDAALDGEGCDFKAALRHRLGACEIQLLPLREHPEDIGELLLYFLGTAAKEAGRPGLLPQEHSSAVEIAAWADLFYAFVAYRWPGNVRELANFAGQVVLASEQALTLPDNVESTLRREGAVTAEPAAQEAAPRPRRNMKDVAATEFERVLESNDFEVAPAARQLGVSRQSMYRRIEDSPGHRLASEVPAAELQQALAEHRGDPVAAALQLRVSLTGLRARIRHLQAEG